MEFFEFDNSFISDKGKATTIYDPRGKGGTKINGEFVSCLDIDEYKGFDMIVVVGGKDTSCINEMPYSVSTNKKGVINPSLQPIDRRFRKF